MITTASGQCTAVLIRRDALVTAGHCVERLGASINIQARFRDPSTGAIRTIYGNALPEDVAIHPAYSRRRESTYVTTLRNDIAVVRLVDRPPYQPGQPIEWIGLLGPVDDVPTARLVRPRATCGYRAVGHGLTDVGDAYGVMRRRSATMCITEFGRGQITARGRSGTVCHGDSGGPLFENRTQNVTGVASTLQYRVSLGCADPDATARYASLWAHRRFLACAIATRSRTSLRRCMAEDPDPMSDAASGTAGSESSASTDGDEYVPPYDEPLDPSIPYVPGPG